MPRDFVSTIWGPDLLVGFLPLQNQWGTTPKAWFSLQNQGPTSTLKAQLTPPNPSKIIKTAQSPKIWDQNAPIDSVIGSDFVT